MRKLSEVTAPILPSHLRVQPCARRPLKSFAGSLTCLALVVHQESDLSLQVSDNNDPISAVWVPKAFLSIDKAMDRGKFIVATLSITIAQQKRLAPYRLRPELLLPEERDQMADAISAAARARNALRGHRQQDPTWRSGNMFA